jgi:hypothetical protein
MSNPVIDQLLAEPTTREAREWLRGSRCWLAGFRRADSQSIVEAAYAAGAVRVFAVSILIGFDTGNECTGTLVLELPTHPEARRKVFAWAAGVTKSRQGGGEVDNGQLCLFVSLVDRPEPGQMRTCIHCNGSGDCYCKRKGKTTPDQCPRCEESGKCHVCKGTGRVGQ